MSNPAPLIQTASKRPLTSSTNFSAVETECLVDEVLKRAAIIENKQTDAVTWKIKEEAWNQVAESFNATTAGTRNVKHLRSKYECIKSNIKKKYNAGRAEQLKTGGGVAKTVLYTPWEEKLMQLISLSVEGLPGRSDSDIVKAQEINLKATESVDELDTDDVVDITGETVMKVVNNNATTSQIPNLENSTKKSLWDSWSPATLKTPKNKKLRTANRTANTHTTNLKNMVTTREELIDLQKKVAEQELLNCH